MQVAYEEEAEDMESLKTWTLSLCIKRTKLYEPANNPFLATPYIVPSMEIHAISLLHLGRNKGCTNASSISRRGWGYGEFFFNFYDNKFDALAQVNRNSYIYIWASVNLKT